MDEKTKQMKRLEDIITDKIPDLIITRVPSKTLKEFKDFANEEFSGKNGMGDYGMALKHIWDSYKSERGTMRISKLEERVQELENLISESVITEEENKEKETFIDGSPVEKTK